MHKSQLLSERIKLQLEVDVPTIGVEGVQTGNLKPRVDSNIDDRSATNDMTICDTSC